MEKDVVIKNLDLDPRFSRSSSNTPSGGLSMGWLLRLFRSEFFDTWMAVSYLYRYRANHGVLDYLCNELYGIEYCELEKYLPQISHMIVYHMKGNPTAERFLMDKCSSSVHFALQVYWFLEAAVQDSSLTSDKEAIKFRKNLRTFCETSTVNGPTNMKTEDAVEMELASYASAKDHMAGSPPMDWDLHDAVGERIDEGVLVYKRRTRSMDRLPSRPLPGKPSAFDLTPLGRELNGERGGGESDNVVSDDNSSDMDDGSFAVIRSHSTMPVSALSRSRQQAAAQERPMYDIESSEQTARSVSAKALRKKLKKIAQLASEEESEAEALKLLTVKQERFNYFNDSLKIMRDLVRISTLLKDHPEAKRHSILTEELKLVNEFMLTRMTSELQEHSPAAVVATGADAYLRGPHIPLMRAKAPALRVLRTLPSESIVLSTKQRAPFMLFVEAVSGQLMNCDGNIFCEHLVHGLMRYKSETYDAVNSKSKTSEQSNDFDRDKNRRDLLMAAYGELWDEREKRILDSSPFRGIPNRSLYAFIVKAGDDLRQEQLAIQLINAFDSILKAEGVNTILRPFTIICLSADAGLVELVPNAISIHTLKKKTPNFKTLRDYFERAFGPVNSARFVSAQKSFIQSMAGYSLVTYFAQVKDRHNGNIMLDTSGRIIHIDFGYMLSNSPGAINFESAPFKLNEELLEVMGGLRSRGYKYFRELFIAGFFAARKHYEIFTTLVEIMVEGTKMPCMKAGKPLVDALRKRFFLGIPEKEALVKINALIDESCNNWRTSQYDKYQYMTNRIL